MSIRVVCDGCGQEATSPDKYAGKSAKCPGCGESIAIPAIGVGFDDVIPKRLGPPKMPPAPSIEMQTVTYGAKIRSEKRAPQKVYITGIKIPITNMLWLIVTFWLASILLALPIAVLGVFFLVMEIY